MYTDFIQQLGNMLHQVEQSDLLTHPWPHMYVKEVIRSNDYRKFSNFQGQSNLKYWNNVDGGRQEWALTTNEVISDQVLYKEGMDKLFLAIAKKFGVKNTTAPEPSVTFWEDNEHFLENDIHRDEFHGFSFTISAMIYLPVDNSQKHYGTNLYTYIGNDIGHHAIKSDLITSPCIAHKDLEHNWKYELTVPFLPNTMFITTNHDQSWHQAPTNIKGDKRVSCMIRWKCES